PEEIEISREPRPDSVPALVRHVTALGPVIRIDLDLEGSDPVEVSLPPARWRDLCVTKGDAVHLRPANVRIFPAA
ncbi:MAG TPA: TOBE-like domain-containing protein, partial [Geminicoccus sp.]|uniref:TOBE-like domain-containing protein n=1 Tax=Geminicoccus sp. TaxID=2024832 RepID=UPI002BB99CAC